MQSRNGFTHREMNLDFGDGRVAVKFTGQEWKVNEAKT